MEEQEATTQRIAQMQLLVWRSTNVLHCANDGAWLDREPGDVFVLRPQTRERFQRNGMPSLCVVLSCVILSCLVLSCLVLRSEEHTSELQSLMRISYAVFCLKKKKLTDSTIC